MSNEDRIPEKGVATDHPQVFFRSESDEYAKAYEMVAEVVDKTFPDEWEAIIKAGQYRMHDVAYYDHPEEQVVVFDFYVTLWHGPNIEHKGAIIEEFHDYFGPDDE